MAAGVLMRPTDNENRIPGRIATVSDPDAQIVVRLFLWRKRGTPFIFGG